MPTLSDSPPDPTGGRLEFASQPAPPPVRSSRRWVIWLLLTAVILAGLAAYLLANRPPQAQRSAPVVAVPTVAVRVGTLERRVRVAGQTSARNFTVITVPIFRGRGGQSGLSLTKLVTGGTRVKTGDIVAEIDPQTYVEQLDDLDDSDQPVGGGPQETEGVTGARLGKPATGFALRKSRNGPDHAGLQGG